MLSEFWICKFSLSYSDIIDENMSFWKSVNSLNLCFLPQEKETNHQQTTLSLMLGYLSKCIINVYQQD